MKDWKQHCQGGKHKQAATDNGMDGRALKAHDAKVAATIPAVIPKTMPPAVQAPVVKKAPAKVNEPVYPVPAVRCTVCAKDVAMKDWRGHEAGKKHVTAGVSAGLSEDKLREHDAAIAASIPDVIPSAKEWFLECQKSLPAEVETAEQASSVGPSSSGATQQEESVAEEAPLRMYFAPAKRSKKKKNTAIEVGFVYRKEKPQVNLPERLLEAKRATSSINSNLQPYTAKITVPCEGSTSLEALGLELSEDLTVSNVFPASSAAAAGFMPSMLLQAVGGESVSTLDDCITALAENTTPQLSMTMLLDSSRQQVGEVREFLTQKGIAFITPLRPLFVQAGLLACSASVYIGDLFYRCDEFDLCEGDKVIFDVLHMGGRLCATNLDVLEHSDAATGKKHVRAGADMASLVKFMKDKHNLRAASICMMFAGGKCDAPKGSLSCKHGIHLSYESKPAEFSELVHLIVPTEPKTYMTCPLGPTSYLGACNKVPGVAEFRTEQGCGTLTLTKNGKELGPFKEIQFRSSGRVQVSFPEVKEMIDVPMSKASVVLGRLRCMAEHAGVKHDIPMSFDKARFKQDLMVQVNASKLELLQQKWTERTRNTSGFWWTEVPKKIINAWQLTNEALEFRFRATEYNMTREYNKAPDMIEGFHGTHEDNVLSIARHGFDPLRRAGQVFGEGEYFAKSPLVSMGYCRGGGFMFLCKLILGKPDIDHTWVDGCEYYIMKQRKGNIQALPMYLIQWSDPTTRLPKMLKQYSSDEASGVAFLKRMGEKQRGGGTACRGRVNGAMVAEKTRHLWLGWLEPSLVSSEQALRRDVERFLVGHKVVEVIPERNGSRIGAYALLETPITQFQLAALNAKPYREGLRISIDDAQPNNPYTCDKPCPLLRGPGRFCRGANLHGHHNWTKACSFKHDGRDEVTANAVLRFEDVPEDSAKFNELAGEVEGMGYKVTRVRRLINQSLEGAYESRRAFLNEKHGSIVEKELWHGTACQVLDSILTKGLQCPADSNPAKDCAVSGGKGLCTTLCDVKCKKCVEPHKWERCHMFGKGIYFADIAEKSHRYVRPHKDGSHSLVRCRVNLGSPYLIKANLLTQDALHNLVACEDPSKHLDKIAMKWDQVQGHESFYVKGLGSAHKYGYGVMNSEYIVFHPYQVLPLYVVDYDVHSAPEPRYASQEW